MHKVKLILFYVILAYHSEPTKNERALVAAFTFIKPFKAADTGHDLLKACTKVMGKAKVNPNGIRKVDNNIFEWMAVTEGHTREC